MQRRKLHPFRKLLIGFVAGALALTAVPLGAAAADSVEILANGNAEGGTTNWASSGTGTSVSLGYSTRHAGAMSLKLNARTNDAHSIYQPTSRLIAGESYAVSAWVHYRDAGDASVNFVIKLRDTTGHAFTMAEGLVAKGSSADTLAFTKIAGTYVIPTSGIDLPNARVSIETSGTTVTPDIFFVDDISVFGQRAPNPPHPAGHAAPAKEVGKSNPLMDYEYGADPFAMEYDGRVYVYMTSDAYELGTDGKTKYTYEYDANGDIVDNSYGKIKTITVISSDDMVNWTNHGQVKVAGRNNSFGVSTWASNSWAPAAAHKTIDGVEKFFLYYANSAGGIGVLESTTPVGPWTDPLNGQALISSATPGVNNLAGATDVVWLFDPAVLVDDDGTGYLYFGGGVPAGQSDFPKTGRAIKLGANMTSVSGSAVLVNAPALFEDSGIHKFNGKYYYSYCTNFTGRPNGLVVDGVNRTIGTGNIAYMVSDSPLGPFTYVDQIMQNPASFFGVGGNNHHAIFEFKDQWYVIYHAQTVFKKFVDDAYMTGVKGYRSTQIDKITINPDGKIPAITMTMQGVPQVDTVNPYARIQSETIGWDSGLADPYSTTTGIRTEFLGTTNDQGMKLTNIDNGEWTALSQVDFGTRGAKDVSFHAAAKAGGTVDVRLDSATGPVVGSVQIAAGDGASYADYTASVTGATGTHNVYFTYSGSSAGLFDLDYLQFTEAPEVVVEPPVVEPPVVEPPVVQPPAVQPPAVKSFSSVGTLTVSGAATYGKTLNAALAGADAAVQTVALQWTRDGQPIAGATSASYSLTASDVGHSVAVSATLGATGYKAATVASSAVSVGKATVTVKQSVKKSSAKKTATVTVKLSSPGLASPVGKVTVKVGSASKTVSVSAKSKGVVVVKFTKVKTGATLSVQSTFKKTDLFNSAKSSKTKIKLSR